MKDVIIIATFWGILSFFVSHFVCKYQIKKLKKKKSPKE